MLVILILMSRASSEVFDPILGVGIDDQGLRNRPHILGIVGDDREAHLDGTGTAGHGDIRHRRIGVDERENALEGIFMERSRIARLGRAEDHGGAGNQRNDVTNGPDLLADRHNAHREAGGNACGVDLLDDAADQEYEDTAGLIALHGLNRFFNGGGGADHDHEAGNVAGNQRNAQLAHLSVGEVAVILRALIGRGIAGILARFDDFRTAGGGNAGIEDGLGAVFAAHHGAQLRQRFLQLTQRGDLLAQVGIDAGEEIRSVGHRHGGAFAELGNNQVQLRFSLEIHFIGTTENSVKQTHLCFHSFPCLIFSRCRCDF